MLGQDVSHLALQSAGLNLVKMTLAGWKQQQVVVVELEVVLDLVEMVVEVVVLVEVLVVVGVVMQHEKKMILNQFLKILMIADFPCADFPCAASSAALLVFLSWAFSLSCLACYSFVM